MKRKLCLLLFFCLLLTAPALRAQQKATPRSGEGISTFLLRHNRAPKKYYNDFIELNKAKLGKSRTLKMGVTYLIPPVKKASAATSGKTTEAAAEKTSAHHPRRTEDEYAYDIALRLARNLMQEGAEVRIIIQDAKDGIRDEAYLSNSKRETCMGSPIPLNQVQRLQQRCDKINALYRKDRKKYKYCRAIFIHVDSRSKGTQTDVFFYHSNRKAESKRLAKNMKETFESKYDKHQPNRGFSGTVSGRNLYVLAHTTPASVFVELGNIQNTFDQRRLVIPSNRQALAKWLMEGFIKDYK